MPGLGPLPAVANVLSVKMKGTYQGQPWLNGIHLQHTAGGAPSAADCVTIANAVAAAWSSNIAALCHSSVSLTEVDVIDLTSTTSAQGTAAVSDAGTRTGTALPVQVACVVSESINSRYRGGHPRIYLPAGVVADITSGKNWTSGFLTAADSAVAAFLTALNAITASSVAYRAVTVSYFTHDPVTHAKMYKVPPVPFTVNSMTVHPRVDTQRRRLGRE